MQSENLELTCDFDHLGLSNFEKNSGIEVFCKTLKQLLKFIYSNIYLFISIYLINSFDRWMVSHCGSIYAVHHTEHTQESNGQNTGGREVLKSRGKGTRISRD